MWFALQLIACLTMIVGAVAVAKPLPRIGLGNRAYALAAAVGGAFVLVLAMLLETVPPA